MPNLMPVLTECFCCGEYHHIAMDTYGIALCDECEEKLSEVVELTLPAYA